MPFSCVPFFSPATSFLFSSILFFYCSPEVFPQSPRCGGVTDTFFGELSFLARIMGTSVRELEDTYFRWLTRTDEQLRAALDAYDAVMGG